MKQFSTDIEELIHLLQIKRQFIDMAIDSLNTLMKKKVNLDVKEISESLTKTLKHLADSRLDIEDIKSKFTILKGNP